MTVSMRIEGEDRLLQSLKDLGSPSSRSHLMDIIGSYGVSSTQERFERQEGPDGTSWEKSARAKESNGQTLVKDSHLLQSLTHDFSADHAVWGSNVVYAGIHQFGGTIRAKGGGKLTFNVGGGFVSVDKVDMPARPYLGINDEDRNEISALVHDWIGETMQ